VDVVEDVVDVDEELNESVVFRHWNMCEHYVLSSTIAITIVVPASHINPLSRKGRRKVRQTGHEGWITIYGTTPT